MASSTATDEELEKQAEDMASKALPATLPESARRVKLPAVKQRILERLKAQRGQAAKAGGGAVGAGGGGSGAPPGAGGAPPVPPGAPPGAPPPPPPGAAPPQPAQPAPPPPPPPSDAHLSAKRVAGVELCGDEPWYSDTAVRKRLRESVAEAHKEQKILVGNPADEILRICPEDGRVLGAGAVLRLGGAHLGGYGESDIAYAYRQLSRALHPDKNPDLPRAPDAFHRLSQASDELRQGLNEQRNALQILVGAMGGQVTAQMLERPQEALFAEATRVLTAIVGVVGEGDVPAPAQARGVSAFGRSGMYHHASVQKLLVEWFDKNQLLELYTSAPVRTAYDCAPKRCRAQFLCLLNRAAIAEGKRFNDCVRGSWPMIMQRFPELGLWRDLRDAIQRRVWDTTGEPAPPAPPPKQDEKAKDKDKKSRSRSRRSRSRSRRRRSRSRSGSQGRRKKGRDAGGEGRENRYAAQDRQRDMAWDARWATSDDPEHDPNAMKPVVEDKKQTSRDRKQAIEMQIEHGWRACRWARKWRGSIAAILPSGLDSAAPYTDHEVRKLGAVLWKDIVKWVSGTDIERVLGLFRADTQTSKTFGWDNKTGEIVVARGLEPGSPQADWSFVPVTDLLLIVGDGFVGATSEGLFASINPLGHKRVPLAQCYKTDSYRKKRAVAEAASSRKENEEGNKNSAKEAKASGRSKWDVQAG